MPEAMALSLRPSTRRWLCFASLFAVVLLLIYYQTTSSMVATWLRSETYTHGFLILPISIWLIWQQRDLFDSIDPQPALSVALLIIPFGAVWLLAWLVDVLVLQQLTMIAMLIVGVWAMLGHRLGRALAFPLLFLFFAVPMGEGLIPPLMEFTATSTVWMIKQTGIPVFREGMYFMLPSGNWSVVEACSGVRYLIASVTLGVLYAHLTYTSLRRKLWFVLAAILVPIIANTLRAYMIVMLGHLSGMTIAVGVDHLIYGWVFFGVVIFLLFWLGSFYREDDIAVPQNTAEKSAQPAKADQRLWPSALLILLISGIWPVLSVVATAEGGSAGGLETLDLPSARGGWTSRGAVEHSWTPDSATSGEVSGSYEGEVGEVSLYIQYSSSSGDGGEVVGSLARFTTRHSAWHVIEQQTYTPLNAESELTVLEAVVRGGRETYLAWSWYRTGGGNFINDYRAKFQELLTSFGLAPPGSYRLVVVTPISGDLDTGRGREVLEQFLGTNLAVLEAHLDGSGGGE